MKNLILLISLFLSAASSMAYVKPVDATSSGAELPAVFQAASPRERIKAIRVAELDATRKLVERIYGVSINSDTVVYDLVLADDQVGAAVNNLIRGVRTAEGPIYQEDGQVWVLKEVKLATVIEEIKKTVRRTYKEGKQVTEEELTTVTREHGHTTLDALGNGALPGTSGLKKIQAKRAAEVDAYRRLAERMLGVQITSTTTVRDMALRSDKIQARLAQVLKGAKPIDVVYSDDGSCTVTMQIKLADIYHVIEHYDSEDKSILKSDIETDTRTLTESGYGLARLDVELPDGPVSDGESNVKSAFPETTIVIRKLVGTAVVAD
ncbi:hypothetical protein [Ruficoccus sp. ZRK36]|uniref:hypothetical protein n=1 Tax=Ruficoccus sp. ZRK36 TaxID=2866311 RepID=UPI001C73CA25|nr:hypothetical protein [Ruficoccus sp. ZRK36]QYY37317.1 hypothetical protein K0V07_07480 [Ruficoccus sp. ZRK36]